MSDSASMNQMIVQGLRGHDERNRRRFGGALERLTGTAPAPAGVDPSLRERLSGALNELDRAKRSGDEAAIHYAEFVVDRAREAARDAREAAMPEPPGFDGGFHGRRGPPGPRLREETSTQLLARSLQVYGAESRARREREAAATAGHQPIVNLSNF